MPDDKQQDLEPRSHDGRDDDDGRAPGTAPVPDPASPVAGGNTRWGMMEPESFPLSDEEAPPDPGAGPQQGGGGTPGDPPGRKGGTGA